MHSKLLPQAEAKLINFAWTSLTRVSSPYAEPSSSTNFAIFMQKYFREILPIRQGSEGLSNVA